MSILKEDLIRDIHPDAPKNNHEALVCAFDLFTSELTDHQFNKASMLVEYFTSHMTEPELAKAEEEFSAKGRSYD